MRARHLWLALALLVSGGAAGVWAVFGIERVLPLPLPASAGLQIDTLGSRYFVNDLVGFAPAHNDLPLALALSHSARAGALHAINNGPLRIDSTDAYGSAQDPTVPGWGASPELPPRHGALQLDYLRTMIVGRFDVDPAQGVELAVSMPWFSRLAHRGDVVVLEQAPLDDATSLRLALRGRGEFQIEALPPPADGFPVQFATTNLAPDAIAIGADVRSPATTAFTLMTRDFHSLAWGELDSDGGAEYSVVRGGNRGRMMTGRLMIATRHPRDVLYDGDTHRDIATAFTDFEKAGCPGRQSAWTDVDSDGLLDLYVVCGRTEGDSGGFTNQLFKAQPGTFTEVARAAGIDIGTVGNFRFIDWDGDLQADLLWVDGRGDIVLYHNNRGSFRETARVSGRHYVWQEASQLLLGDINRDGAPDLLVVNREGNQIVWNRNGNIEVDTDPAALGLPAAALAGSWIDVDLDGLTDFLTVDSGVYRGLGNGRFANTGGTGRSWLRRFYPAARLVSFNVGAERQLLAAYNRCLPGRLCLWRTEALIAARRWAPLAFAQQDFGWLEPEDWQMGLIRRGADNGSHREVILQLAGPAQNPNSIGAHIDIGTDQSQPRHWVGEAETALFSQGNFAIYLSVPQQKEIRGNAVWSDGCKQDFIITAPAKTLTVTYPAQCKTTIKNI